MKRLLALLILAALLAAALPAAADPLPLDGDLEATFVVPYDGVDPSAGALTFSFRYPRVSADDPEASLVNSFYAGKAEELETNVYFLADGYADAGRSVSISISYRITCNSDDYFSVLIIRDSVTGDVTRTRWEGNTFSRKSGTPDVAFDLARLLGLVAATEQDEYRQSMQRKPSASCCWI